MARVYLEYINDKWEKVKHSDFWIDEWLLNYLDNIKMIQKKGWDAVIIIDGKERSGKSVLGMICGWYLSDTKFNKHNFARGIDDCAKKIADLPDKSVIQIDEGSVSFSSKDSTTKEQKKLVKILDVVGQKNLIFIVCLPCIFDLNKTIAVRRSLFLLHVYPGEKYARGRYAFWGEKSKKKLYKFGKQNFDSYAYPSADFIGDYFNFEPHFYKEYLEEVKKITLNEVLQDALENDNWSEKFRLKCIKIAANLMEEFPDMTKTKLSEILDTPRTTVTDWLKENDKNQKY